MTRLAKVQLALCAAAIVAEIVFVLLASNIGTLSVSDIPIALLLLGPYAALALLGWWRRRDRLATGILLAATIALAAWGLYVGAHDGWLFRTNEEYRKVQRLAPFATAAAQWVFVLLLAAVSFFLGRRRAKRA